MHLRNIQKGDAVFATVKIINDGSVPGSDLEEIFAIPGTMGMLLNTGYVEEDPNTELFLVSFRNENGEPGPPVTCLADELSMAPLS